GLGSRWSGYTCPHALHNHCHNSNSILPVYPTRLPLPRCGVFQLHSYFDTIEFLRRGILHGQVDTRDDELGICLALRTPGWDLFISLVCPDRKSTRLNSSHVSISYAVFCLKKKIKNYHY